MIRLYRQVRRKTLDFVNSVQNRAFKLIDDGRIASSEYYLENAHPDSLNYYHVLRYYRGILGYPDGVMHELLQPVAP